MHHRRVSIGLLPHPTTETAHYAVLDPDLRLLWLESSPYADLPALVNRYPTALVALAAPLGPSLGQLSNRAALRERLGLNGTAEQVAAQMRASDYQLRLLGLPIDPTPPAEQAAPELQRLWSLVAELRTLGLQAYHPANAAPRQLLEANPTASFAVLIGHRPYPANTLEGRLQRQILLFDQGLPVPEPMAIFEEITRHRLLKGQLDLAGLHTPAELDVLITAHTAHLAATRSAQIHRLGDPLEGELVLPVAHLKPRYD